MPSPVFIVGNATGNKRLISWIIEKIRPNDLKRKSSANDGLTKKQPNGAVRVDSDIGKNVVGLLTKVAINSDLKCRCHVHYSYSNGRIIA